MDRSWTRGFTDDQHSAFEAGLTAEAGQHLVSDAAAAAGAGRLAGGADVTACHVDGGRDLRRQQRLGVCRRRRRSGTAMRHILSAAPGEIRGQSGPEVTGAAQQVSRAPAAPRVETAHGRRCQSLHRQLEEQSTFHGDLKGEVSKT